MGIITNFSPMRFPIWRVFAVAAAFLLCFHRAASCATSPLDQKRIHAQYNEGDFDGVVTALEGFKKRNPTCSRADSLFIAKHLAVVYSANPDTREKGKYYMNVLLELLPSAKLVDMYVSDEIDRIFEKVREEFLTRQAAFGVDTARIDAPQSAPRNSRNQVTSTIPTAKAKPDEKSGSTLYWVAGGAAVAAAGVAAYFLFSSEPPKDKIYRVPQSNP
jgi:hypothetical protein